MMTENAKLIDLKPLILFCDMSDDRAAATRLARYAQDLLPLRGMGGDLALLMALSARNSQDDKQIQQAEAILVSHMGSDSRHDSRLAQAYSHVASRETISFMAPKICEAYRNIPDIYAERNEFDREGFGYTMYALEPNENRDHYEDALKRLTKKYAHGVDAPTIYHIIKRLKFGARKVADQEQIDPTAMLEIGCNLIAHPETCLRPEVKRDLLGMMQYSIENTLAFTFSIDYRPSIVQRVETLLYGRPIRRNQLDPIIKLFP